MNRRYSVAVIGGGPAGIATALFLAKSAPELTGRIVVLEKERYPREKFCAGALGARADRLLESIGVRVDVPSVPIGGIRVRADGRTRAIREPNAGRVVRRIEFDHELARAAMARGIEVRDGVRVTAVTPAEDSVTVQTSQGEVRADVVIGADGVSGITRRALGFAASPHVAQAVEVDTEPVASDGDRDLLLFDLSNRGLAGYYWDFPTLVGGREMVCRGVYYLKSFDRKRPLEIEDLLAKELASRGLDLDDYRKKRFAERGFHPTDRIAVPRVLLVGEAAGIDPITGEGIAQAIQYGAFAGRYVGDAIREGDVRFSDAASALGHASVGLDLHVRSRALALAYGPWRPRVERFLVDTPDFVRLGLQHFAGKKWSAGTVLRAASGACAATLRAYLGTGLSPVVGTELT